MPADVVALGTRRKPTRPQHRGELRRGRLLAALSTQLEDQSLAEVSVAAVADKAGLGRSAFYFYFSSKNEAVTHLLSDIFEQQIEEVGQIINGAGDPIANLSRALHVTVESWIAQQRKLLAMLDARDADAETSSIWDSWLSRYEDFVAGYIDEHLRCGPASARDLAHCLISLNERVLERYLRGRGLETVDDVHTTLNRIWSAAIFGGGS